MSRIEKGCFIEKDTDYQKYRPFMKMLGCGKVYRVPLRTKGLTSSGIPNECHSNVALAVKAFGGRQIFGYSLLWTNAFGQWAPSRALELLHHSVWETPEGKWVDITNGQRRSSEVSDECWFTPVAVSNPKTETIFGVTNFTLRGNYKKQGVWTYEIDPESETNRCIPWGRLKIVPVREIFQNRVPADSDREKICIKGGGFTEPSIFTNKTFSEIQAERLAA